MKDLHKNISKYYTGKVIDHGATPPGVDWKDEHSQVLRFEQLLRIVRERDRFSINDLGCGYGRLLPHMMETGFRNIEYLGYDVSEEMIKKANSLTEQSWLTADIRWSFEVVTSSAGMKLADYTVASGIFNVKMQHRDEEWLEYVLDTLADIDRFSSKGFAINVLTAYSDADRMRPDLYYADPCFLFDHCKRRFSRNVALLHDYDLYEFTLLVRKG
jgi:SAM-dependent methyltransferase